MRQSAEIFMQETSPTIATIMEWLKENGWKEGPASTSSKTRIMTNEALWIYLNEDNLQICNVSYTQHIHVSYSDPNMFEIIKTADSKLSPW